MWIESPFSFYFLNFYW